MKFVFLGGGDVPQPELFSDPDSIEVVLLKVLLATHLRIQLLTFLFKVLHIRHPCYLFTLFHFASSARTENLIVTAHRPLAMDHSFTVGACGLCFHSLPHWIQNKRALARFVGLVGTYFKKKINQWHRQSLREVFHFVD
jgi:hypothetical protein